MGCGPNFFRQHLKLWLICLLSFLELGQPFFASILCIFWRFRCKFHQVECFYFWKPKLRQWQCASLYHHCTSIPSLFRDAKVLYHLLVASSAYGGYSHLSGTPSLRFYSPLHLPQPRGPCRLYNSQHYSLVFVHDLLSFTNNYKIRGFPYFDGATAKRTTIISSENTRLFLY